MIRVHVGSPAAFAVKDVRAMPYINHYMIDLVPRLSVGRNPSGLMDSFVLEVSARDRHVHYIVM